MANMTVAEFVADPDCMKGYKEWLQNPVTQALVDMARDFKVPAPLKNPTGDQALYQYGLVEGVSLAVTFFTRMEDLAKQRALAEAISQAPDYGAADILETKERGRKI